MFYVLDEIELRCTFVQFIESDSVNIKETTCIFFLGGSLDCDPEYQRNSE